MKGKVIFRNFSSKANTALRTAEDKARELFHEYLATEDILLGIIASRGNAVCVLLGALNVTTTMIEQRIRILLQVFPGTGVPKTLPRTPGAEKSLASAVNIAQRMGTGIVGTHYMLTGLASEHEGSAAIVLQDLGVTEASIAEAIELVEPTLQLQALDSEIPQGIELTPAEQELLGRSALSELRNSGCSSEPIQEIVQAANQKKLSEVIGAVLLAAVPLDPVVVAHEEGKLDQTLGKVFAVQIASSACPQSLKTSTLLAEHLRTAVLPKSAKAILAGIVSDLNI